MGSNVLKAYRTRLNGQDSGWVEVRLKSGAKLSDYVQAGDESPADKARKRSLVAWAVGRRLGMIGERGAADVGLSIGIWLGGLMWLCGYMIYRCF